MWSDVLAKNKPCLSREKGSYSERVKWGNFSRYSVHTSATLFSATVEDPASAVAIRKVYLFDITLEVKYNDEA